MAIKPPKAWPLLLLSTLLTIPKLTNADNPIVQTLYTADPAPIIHNNCVYVFTGHDENNSTNYDMRDWQVFSSDMVNWQHHPSPMSLDTFAWAGQVIARNNRFYFYVPIRNSATGGMAIGVGVSDSITGPYEDAIGSPLLENAQIDPTVFIDDDGQAYMYWGNPDLLYVTLNEDMISYSGEITKVNLTVPAFGPREDTSSTRPSAYEEGPWLSKRDGTYYLTYAAVCCPEDIRYSTGSSATGPWTYGGVIMPTEGGSFTNHPGLIDFQGTSYFFYHNGALLGGGGFTRSVAVESFEYNSDGSIPEMRMSTEGPAQISPLDPFTRQEAETMAWSSGVQTEVNSEGGVALVFISDGSYVKVKGVGFGDGAGEFVARVASGSGGEEIELRLDGEMGVIVGVCAVRGTGGWQVWSEVRCEVGGEAVGTRDLFLRFTGGEGYLFNVDWWQFGK